jgi:hypothetical protein
LSSMVKDIINRGIIIWKKFPKTWFLSKKEYNINI